MKAFVIDIDKCNGCYNCQVACKDEHVGNDWTPIAAPQPDTGHFWMKVTDVVKGTVPKVRVRYMLEMCQQCAEAPCMAAAPDAVYRREDGLVIIDPQKAKGNRALVDACPYGAVYWNDELQLAQKCTGCAHLVDQGWKEPRCVDACPTGALKFGDEEELKDLIAQAEALGPELNTKPRVHYFNLPNTCFVAGAVYDPEADECLAGATVSLRDAAGGAIESLATDEFGDFWFEKRQPGDYSLLVEKSGYRTVTIDAIDVRVDVNVGDIELHQEAAV
jgi:tetrathionate reductase subunit B